MAGPENHVLGVSCKRADVHVSIATMCTLVVLGSDVYTQALLNEHSEIHVPFAVEQQQSGLVGRPEYPSSPTPKPSSP